MTDDLTRSRFTTADHPGRVVEVRGDDLGPAGGSAPAHLYVHVPFCGRRCSYCDFAIAVRRTVPVDDYVDGVRREMEVRSLWAPRTEALDTLYLGGGTPSRLGAEGVVRLVDAVRERFAIATDAEVTIEANPEDASRAAIAAWRAAGVNRVSLGVQSFDPGVLRWMHRTHDPLAIHRAVAALGDAGIANWSLDLMYALPASVQRDWSRDLDLALSLHPPHVSAYGLTVESGTPLDRWRQRGEVLEADEGRYESEFMAAHHALTAAGLEHYEVSNFARPGLRSRHNSAYWSGVSYLGVGPSAHGFDGRVRRWNAREYARWLARLQRPVLEDPVAGSESLTPEQQRLESAYLGLRTTRGAVVEPDDAEMVSAWEAAGWGTIREGKVSLTPYGWLRLDALVSALTAHRSRF